MNERTPASIAERKTRERLAFLALPPREAQRLIRLGAPALVIDVTAPDQDLGYGLREDPMPDEMVDH